MPLALAINRGVSEKTKERCRKLEPARIRMVGDVDGQAQSSDWSAILSIALSPLPSLYGTGDRPEGKGSQQLPGFFSNSS